ncbi:hypothetical protein COV04_03855 [Candidatus Uhrbacteria bacterium CG10_big_fil_rev_8_21_14_0_10_48_11]|uniref:arginine decarboxylase n=1 Tax=Candidatus Uhrbacteria bacterium CG10_big_fil_rev_8_21_14_0_10_48_11 TaxID=1975037 RepID=A0A2M8LE29_9BACT|nr:MAG: hypothetical protein COV04_03855 [Candidatus Uhrbacteria bacterium CG10_big_fil_rev_8_21_14_0_10_48_11]
MAANSVRKSWKLGRAELDTQWFDVSRDGMLLVKEGNYQYNIYDLVKKYGSPLEIVFPHILEEKIEQLFAAFKTAMRRAKYRGRISYHYPMKVNQNKEFIIPILSEGADLEVTSYNELWLLKKLWGQNHFNASIKVLCNGPKIPKYIDLITELRNMGLSIVPIIEDLGEIERLKGFKGDVGIRANIDIKVRSHWDKRFDQFGTSPEAILKLGRIKNLKILHYHLGSQIEDGKDIVLAAQKLTALYIKLRKTNPTLDTLDLGGGFAVPYSKTKLYPVDAIANSLVKTISKMTRKAGVPAPNLIVEWGRYAAAPAQISIFKIIHAKPVGGGSKKKWYVIDGSFMNDLLDTWAIHQKWHVVPVNRLNARRMIPVWLNGSSCDSDDKYTASGTYIRLPNIEDLEEGEQQYIAIFDTGAYQDALASHHCLLSSPAKIVAQDGDITLARRRETPEEIGKLFGW